MATRRQFAHWSVSGNYCARDEKKSRTEHCGIQTCKFGERVVEREDFGWTHKCEIARGINKE